MGFPCTFHGFEHINQIRLEAEPGTVRYITSGAGDKAVTIKQKYYVIKLDLAKEPENISLSLARKIYYIKGNSSYGEETYYTRENKYDLNNIQSYPDFNIDLSKIQIIKDIFNYTNPKIEYNFLNTFNNPLIDDYSFTYYRDELVESIRDVINNLPENTDFDFAYEAKFYFGEIYIAGWACFGDLDNKIDSTLPPGPLDFDYTKEQAEDKIKDLQIWANKNLLPPIFGLTNCVYFPSDLGDTKPTDTPSARNPVIKSYPDNGIIFEETNLDGLYASTADYKKVTGKKDEQYNFVCVIPSFTIQDRFYIPEDFEDLVNFKKIQYTTKPLNLRVNQIVTLKFAEQSAIENDNLILDQKFNGYDFSGIITSVNLPRENEKTKAEFTVKLIQDYNLTETQQFIARVYVIDSQKNNFVQNETYSIKRYYKKDLGIGPRLGGSVMETFTNNIDNQVPSYESPAYKLTMALKDDERLNKPYENVMYLSTNIKTSNQGNSNYELTHEFTASDLSASFEYLFDGPGGLFDFPSKQFLDYRCYVIKNLDEHDFDYYKKLSKIAGGFNIFSEANENANLTFGKYP